MTREGRNDEQVSLKGRVWRTRVADPAAARRMVSAGLSEPAARILSSRSLGDVTIPDFMDPTLRKMMPDPLRFQGMQRGSRHVADLISKGGKIGIWSDYDVDGATSAAILGRFLRMVGAGEAPLRIPDRILEGYGPNAPGLTDMKKQGCDTVCVLDAGTVAFEPLEAAGAAGLDVVVIDHHASEENLPPATAVINPNRRDERPGYGHLCAAGMTFIFCVEVARVLRDRGYFDGKNGRPPRVPDLMNLLDLVALGTVCDVVPLTGLNRAFVYRGLRRMSERETSGIVALAEVAGVAPATPFTSADCGWRLGPRINAGGRIDDSTLGARCLLTDDAEEAEGLAARLEACNRERKSLEQGATDQALEQIDGREPGERGSVIAIVDGHEGVVGISASRVKEAADAPAIVLTRDHEGNLKGSARSVPGFDVGHAIIEARQAGLVMKGGGHGMAGGVTLSPDQVDGFRAFLDGKIRESAFFRDGVVTEADLEMRVRDLRVEALDGLGQLEPTGTANPEPVLLLKDAELRGLRVLKERHLKLKLGDGPAEIDALLWNVIDTPLGSALMKLEGHVIDVMGKPGINEFRGRRTAQVMVDDVRIPAGTLL